MHIILNPFSATPFSDPNRDIETQKAYQRFWQRTATVSAVVTGLVLMILAIYAMVGPPIALELKIISWVGLAAYIPLACVLLHNRTMAKKIYQFQTSTEHHQKV